MSVMTDRSTAPAIDSGWSRLSWAGAVFAVVMALTVLSIPVVSSFLSKKKR
jgi:hypothetical protein